MEVLSIWESEIKSEVQLLDFPRFIQKIWEDRNQYEEVVQQRLQKHEREKPGDIFY